MSEAQVLLLVTRYPHPRAFARHARDRSVFEALRRLEGRGFVTRQHGQVRLTRDGRDELAMMQALIRLVAKTGSPLS
jgi:DNA-binding MarR family transcriptional regulator